MNKGQNLTRRVALVTGANKGIGFEVARQLAQRGMTVFLGARDAARGGAAAKALAAGDLDVRPLILDLARPETMQVAAEAIDGEFQRLDILVNNAGVNDPEDGSPGTVDLDAVRRVFETNFFGTVLVTQIMLPLIRKSASGRIVNVSSGLGSLSSMSAAEGISSDFAQLLGYSSSKAALNMFTIHLARELKGTGILVNAAAPGFTATDMNNFRGHQTVEEGARVPVQLALLPNDGPTGGYFDKNGPKTL
ncbi:MAG: SDR family NAD(P)-dependent oxidoreductase [Fimbriimonas sp.]|nr:SDR family NAD(P)-dependent oxidoreductase [Fimbriimonas sp.]